MYKFLFLRRTYVNQGAQLVVRRNEPNLHSPRSCVFWTSQFW